MKKQMYIQVQLNFEQILGSPLLKLMWNVNESTKACRTLKENKIRDASPPGFKASCPVTMIDTVALAEGQKLGSMKQNKELKHFHIALQTALEKKYKRNSVEKYSLS